MVLTVTLNPVLDRVVEIPSFKARGVNIVKESGQELLEERE